MTHTGRYSNITLYGTHTVTRKKNVIYILVGSKKNDYVG
jgi:hypothetical protein